MNDNHLMEESFDRMDPSNTLILWLCHFLARLQKRHYVPDVVVQLLLSFLSVFLRVVGQLLPQLSGLSDSFPPTLYKLQKIVCTPHPFVRYVSCEKCYTIYELTECIRKNGTQEEPSHKNLNHKNLNHGRPSQTKPNEANSIPYQDFLLCCFKGLYASLSQLTRF